MGEEKGRGAAERSSTDGSAAEGEADHGGETHEGTRASSTSGASTTSAGGGCGGYAGCPTGVGHTRTTTSTPGRNTGPTSTTTPGTTTMVENKCHTFIANLRINPLQEYEHNPDRDAMGVATLDLCTNGTLKATAMLHNGKSMLIATHIHLAPGGTNGANGEGPPMINFCGSNRAGMINDGTPYPEDCPLWSNNRVKIDNIDGVLVTTFNRGVSVAQRVADIAARPEMYYFNVHTLASWKEWQSQGPKGICRGKLVVRDI